MFVGDPIGGLQSPIPGHRRGAVAAYLTWDLSTRPHRSTTWESHIRSPKVMVRNGCFKDFATLPVT